jgi:Holliday junction resolvase RusA-like endonuclease
MRVEFTVPGDPQGKQRPRFSQRTGQAYTPPKTRDYERLIRDCYRAKYGDLMFPEGATVLMFVTAYFGIPKSATKAKAAKMLQGIIRPTKVPDWDNIGKVFGDAGNGCIYHDDKCVVQGTVEKYYSTDPRVEVVLVDMEEYMQWQDG